MEKLPGLRFQLIRVLQKAAACSVALREGPGLGAAEGEAPGCGLS